MAKTFVLGALLFAVGCATATKTNPSFDPKKIMDEAYAEVDIKDGINEEEALLLGSAYFGTYLSGCGAAGEAVDQQDKWEVKTVIGYVALPYESIFIEKQTGKITCKKGPTVYPP